MKVGIFGFTSKQLWSCPDGIFKYVLSLALLLVILIGYSPTPQVVGWICVMDNYIRLFLKRRNMEFNKET